MTDYVKDRLALLLVRRYPEASVRLRYVGRTKPFVVTVEEMEDVVRACGQGEDLVEALDDLDRNAERDAQEPTSWTDWVCPGCSLLVSVVGGSGQPEDCGNCGEVLVPVEKQA